MNTKLVYLFHVQREVRKSIKTMTQKIVIKTLIGKSILIKYYLGGIKIAQLTKRQKSR